MVCGIMFPRTILLCLLSKHFQILSSVIGDFHVFILNNFNENYRINEIFLKLKQTKKTALLLLLINAKPSLSRYKVAELVRNKSVNRGEVLCGRR